MSPEDHRRFTPTKLLVVTAFVVLLAVVIVRWAGSRTHRDGVKRAHQRAHNEIAAMSVAIESYFRDNGDYPRSKSTDELDPRVDGSPTTGVSGERYRAASIDLYSALSGDFDPKDHPDFKPEPGKKIYFEFKRDQLNVRRNADGKIGEVKFIQDPWGNAYGYSTAGSKDRRNGSDSVSPQQRRGYNATFDLWTTVGSTSNAVKEGEQLDVKKWVKNW